MSHNAISGLLFLAKYIKASIALKYGTSGPRTFFYSFQGQYGSFFFFISNDKTIIGVLKR